MRNELVSFALSPGANVMTAEEWAEEIARLQGFAPGVAKSEEMNTVIRLTMFASAMIGEFTMRGTGYDVLDDGDVEDFVRKFREAIAQVGNHIASPLRPYWLTVNSATLSAPPTVVDIGATYLIPPNATGDWLGRDNFLAQWDGKKWVYRDYPSGSVVGAEDTRDVLMQEDDGSWRSWYATLSEAVEGERDDLVISPKTLVDTIGHYVPVHTYSSFPPVDPKPTDLWTDADLDVMFARLRNGDTDEIWLQVTL